jgi:hypothetical protein
MKKNIGYAAILFMLVAFTSCIKNDGPTGSAQIVAEFDAAVLNTPLTGQKYPMLQRVPKYGSAVASGTTDPAITRTSGNIKFRVNLVGPQQPTDQTLNIKVVASPALGTGVDPAVAGTHFTVPATMVIPANSSYGEVTITIIDPGASSATPVGFVIEIEGNGTVKPSENYKFLGVRISQT